jgi:hypothetical protein
MKTKTVRIYDNERLLRVVNCAAYAKLDSAFRLDLEPNSTHYLID